MDSICFTCSIDTIFRIYKWNGTVHQGVSGAGLASVHVLFHYEAVDTGMGKESRNLLGGIGCIIGTHVSE